jgi:hypothetical protein
MKTSLLSRRKAPLYMAVPTSLAVADTILLIGCLGAGMWLIREMKETAQSLDEMSSRLYKIGEQVDHLEARVGEILRNVDARAAGAAETDRTAATSAPKPPGMTRRKAARPKAGSAKSPGTADTAGTTPSARRATRPRKEDAAGE